MPVVLLTPVGLDAGCWEGCDLPEAERHEWPGTGGRPTADAPTIADLADAVAAEHAGPLDLVGASLGGMVAMQVAARHPDRVRSLFVACTTAVGDPATMQERATQVRTDTAAAVDTTLERWFTPATLADADHPGVAYARRTLERLEPEAFAAHWLAIASHDVRDRLPDVRVPLTCLAGRQDRSSPVAAGEAIAAAVGGARLVVLDGPHMLVLERPDAFSAEVRDHLARVGT